MARVSIKKAKRPNSQAELDFGKKLEIIDEGPAAKSIRTVSRKLWQQKLAPNLAAVGNIGERRAEQILSGAPGTSGDLLVYLLWSEKGGEFLRGFMAEADRKPVWWRAFERELELAETRNAEIEIRRRRESLEKGELV